MSSSSAERHNLAEPLSVAGRLKRDKQLILERWEERARKALPATSLLEPLSLIDTLPEIIDQMVGALSQSTPGTALKRVESDLARSHGRERALHDTYSLEQVIAEYHLLRSVIFETLGSESPLELSEKETITDILFLAIRNAASEFATAREIRLQAAQARLNESHSEIARRLAENANELVFSRELLNSINQGVHDYAIFTLDPNGNITTWNQGAVRMKEYTVEEALGRHFSMLYPHDGRMRDEPMSHLRTATVEGRFRGEGMRVKKSGEHFLADVLITPMYKDGKLFGFCKIVQDLSERSQLIQERDINNTQIQTLQLEKDLKERFVSTLTHDLRNPLSAAYAIVQLIARYPCEKGQHRELATRGMQSIQRVDRMITNLLDVSRMKAGESLPISVTRCDLKEVLAEVHAELVTTHGSQFVVLSDESVVGYWDCESLKRVIENLASNAVKYGDPTTPITLSLQVREDRAHLKVHNFGPAIQSKDISSLFEPFQRVTQNDVNPKKGWGLGLSLVRGIAEAHGGMVKVESYPREGTTFTVDLPLDSRPFRRR
jgi:PAS domain S-box-containing protein